MARRRTNRLLALNDSRLAPFLSARTEEDRDGELELILRDVVGPIAGRTIAAFTQGDWPIAPHDRDDVASQVSLRILRKFRAALVLEEESVQDLEAYVAIVTRNILCDVMRARSPGRMRVRSRLRYLLARDARLAVWNRQGAMIVGLAGRSGEEPAQPESAVMTVALKGVAVDSMAAADAIVLLVSHFGSLRFSTLVSTFADVWSEQDPESELSEAIPVVEAPAHVGHGLEWRQYLQILWQELRELPHRQRIALLLNLRAPETDNVIALFVAAGVARFEEIAAALEMLPKRLTDLWEELPLSDIDIASLLGGSRQQVINLRKSARARLMRRMSGHTRPD
jgi:hypothetical protein